MPRWPSALALLALALCLWGVVLTGGLPWHLELRLFPRPVPPQPAAAAGWRALHVASTSATPGVSGLAVGDRVQFDRYGVLAPLKGSQLCVWIAPGGVAPDVQITPLGGRLTYAAPVVITPDVPASRCP